VRHVGAALVAALQLGAHEERPYCAIVVFAKPLAGRNLLPGWQLGVGRDAMPATNTEVEIFGAVYNVRGSEDREYLQNLAGLVDRKMREVAQHVKGDVTRIAILAALNMADELFRVQRQQEGERVEIREKVAELTEELSQALGG
jgi:cell division protein ZapA